VAGAIRSGGAGVVFPRTLDAADDAIDELQRAYARYAARARQLAVERFDVQAFWSRYRGLYEQLGGVA